MHKPQQGDPLTEREKQLVAQVTKGLSNTEIGKALNISETTVKNHLTNIMTKTGHKNRTALAVMAQEVQVKRMSEALEEVKLLACYRASEDAKADPDQLFTIIRKKAQEGLGEA